MALLRYLKEENIRIGQIIESKDEVLVFLATLAAEAGLGVPRRELVRRLVEREKTMSTGIGNGVGVPHTLVEGIHGLHVFVLTLSQPIPFDAVDRMPVGVIFGMFGEPERPNMSLSALATLGRILRDANFVNSLQRAGSPGEVYEKLNEKEGRKEP